MVACEDADLSVFVTNRIQPAALHRPTLEFLMVSNLIPSRKRKEFPLYGSAHHVYVLFIPLQVLTTTSPCRQLPLTHLHSWIHPTRPISNWNRLTRLWSRISPYLGLALSSHRVLMNPPCSTRTPATYQSIWIWARWVVVSYCALSWLCVVVVTTVPLRLIADLKQCALSNLCFMVVRGALKLSPKYVV